MVVAWFIFPEVTRRTSGEIDELYVYLWVRYRMPRRFFVLNCFQIREEGQPPGIRQVCY